MKLIDRSPLSKLPLPVALHRASRDQVTGRITIVAPSGPSELYLREGYPVSARVPGADADHVGLVLKEAGVLTEEQLAASLVPLPAGLRYGQSLMLAGLIQREQLVHALKAQTRRRLHRMFHIEDGELVVEAGDHAEGIEEGEILRVQPRRAIYQGVRGAWTRARVEQALAGALDEQRIRLLADAETLTRYALTRDDRPVALLLAERYWTVPELEATGVDPQIVLALVAVFYFTDALDVRPIERRPTIPPVTPMATPAVPKRGTIPPTAAGAPATSLRPGASGAAPATPARSPTIPPNAGAARSPTIPPNAGAARSPTIPPNAGAARSPTIPPNAGAARSPTIPPNAGAARASATPEATPAAAATSLATGAGAAMRTEIVRRATVVDQQSFFEVLDVPREAGKGEIKASYFNLVKILHPDRVAAAGLKELHADATRVFRKVCDAYAVLSDDNARAAYVHKLDHPDEPIADEAARKILEAELCYLRADMMIKQRDYAGALPELRKAVEGHPGEGEYLAVLSWARLCAGEAKHADIKAPLVEAIKKSPKCARAHYYLGVVLREEDDLDAAAKSFERAVKLDERLTEAATELRVLNMRREKGKGLFDRFRKK